MFAALAASAPAVFAPACDGASILWVHSAAVPAGEVPALHIGIDVATGAVACASVGTAGNATAFAASGSTWLGDDIDGAPPTVLSVSVNRTGDGGVRVLRKLAVFAAPPTGSPSAPPYTAYRAAVVDTFEPSAELGGITWTASVRGEPAEGAPSSSSSPWRTAVVTQLTFGAGFAERRWVPRAGLARNGSANAEWDDVLALEPVGVASASRRLQYGERFLSAPQLQQLEVTPLPYVLHASVTRGAGLALVHSLRDADALTYGATMTAWPNGSRWSRYYNRLGGSSGGSGANSSTVLFTTHLVPLAVHAGPRDVLRFAARAFPAVLEPSPAADCAGLAQLGLGMYSCAGAADLNASALAAAGGANVLWDASFWWPFQGMFLPPEGAGADVEWTSNQGGGEQAQCGQRFAHGQRASLAAVRAASAAAAAANLTLLAYFNLNFFGQNPAFPPLPPGALPPPDPETDWLNSSVYLARHFNGSSCAPPAGTCAERDWQGSVTMDAGDAAWADFLVAQAGRKGAALGATNFRGIVIDEPHVQEFVFARDDGAAWCGRPCASMLGGWLAAGARVAAAVRAGARDGGIVLVNQIHVLRPELLRVGDGVFTEAHPAQADSPRYVNAVGLLTTRCPGIVWTESAAEVAGDGTQTDADAYFHHRLYMGVLPMAPALGNDHAIGPADAGIAAVARTYADHGHMLRELRGARWLLRHDALRVAAAADGTASTAALLGNAFEVAGQPGGAPSKLLAVAIARHNTGGGSSSSSSSSSSIVANVTLSFVLPAPPSGGATVELAGCEITHAAQPWVAVTAQKAADGRWEVRVASLLRGCAMLRCALTVSQPPSPAVSVEVGGAALHNVSDSALSYTLDSATLLPANAHGLAQLLADPLVAARAAHLAPFYLRVGGTSGDFIQFNGSASAKPAPLLPELATLPPPPFCRGNLTGAQLAGLIAFARAAGARLVLGLNGLVRVGARQAGAWDPANAEALFAHAAAAAAAAAAGHAQSRSARHTTRDGDQLCSAADCKCSLRNASGAWCRTACGSAGEPCG
jgi:hypothetical protein